MVRRKIRDAEDARACLAAAEACGQSRAAWARSNGVDARSLNAWRLNLKRRHREETVELRLVELVPSQPTAASRVAQYRVHCGPFTVQVDGGFDEEVLARLLAVVSRC